jgi:hypothetical protein
VREWLEAHPRIHLHFTPTSSSWLNAVEGWFAQLERRALYRGVFTSVPELKTELQRFISAHNAYSAKPFKWTKPAAHIIAAVGRAKHALHNYPHGPLADVGLDSEAAAVLWLKSSGFVALTCSIRLVMPCVGVK